MADPNLEDATIFEAAASNAVLFPPNSSPTFIYAIVRQVIAMAKKFWDRIGPVLTSGGSANAQTLTHSVATTAYVRGQSYSFVAGFSNSGATTLNVDGLGAMNVTKAGTTPLAGGEIIAGAIVRCEFDGTQFQLTSGVFSAALPTLTNHALQVGAGTTTATQLAPGTAGTVPTSNGASADPSYQAIPSSGFRNWLLNGAMGVWQRGAGGSASIALAASTTAYTADRWYLSTLTGQASTVAQTAIATLAGTRYAARVQRNSGQTGTGVMVFAQPLDSDTIAAIVGQTCVLSAQVSTGANWSPASGTLSYKVYCGAGGVQKRNASAYFTETAPISGSTNFAQGASVAPITIASGAIPAGTTQMEIQFFWTPVGTAGANDWFQISNIQLEIGSVATPFDAARQNFVAELAQCQRFYEKTFPYATAPAQSAGTAGSLGMYTVGAASSSPYAVWYFRAVKRSTPSMTFYNPSSANSNWRDITGASDGGASSASLTSDASCLIIDATQPASGQHVLAIQAQADAEI